MTLEMSANNNFGCEENLEFCFHFSNDLSKGFKYLNDNEVIKQVDCNFSVLDTE